MTIADIILIVLLAAALAFAVRRVVKNKGGCSCGCEGCAHAKECHKKS